MCEVVSSIFGAIGDAIDGVWDVIVTVWDELAMPLLEEVFAWFGIVDETVVHVSRTSVAIFQDVDEDVVHKANVKAVMSMVTVGGSFFPWYMNHTRQIQAQMRGYYRYAEHDRYIHGLPTASVKGQDVDLAAIDLALDTDLGFAATRLSMAIQIPSDETYLRNELQASPTLYRPFENLLTFTDTYGATWNDWFVDTYVYNVTPDTWSINILRTAAEALFWIEGPVHVVEGDSATYTIKCNRTVPAGETVNIQLTYGGTAPPGDYTPVASVTMLAGTDSITAVVPTIENVAVDGSRTIIVTIDSITNTNAAFETVGIHTIDSVTTSITDDEGIILTMPSVLVTEAAGNAIIPVKLEAATAGAFTVNYGFTDGTALGGGVDYTSTPGVLNFVGTAGEVQNITVPITTDAADDNEFFTVLFTACSDPAVDITYTSTVTITDDSDLTPVAGDVLLYDVITEPGFTAEQSLVVKYHKDTDPATDWYYWIYVLSDLTYPDIDPTMSVMTDLDMLPIGILRRDAVSINTDKTTAEYKTTKRLLDMVFLDIDDIISNIETNPDIDLIDDAYVHFSMSPDSTAEIVSKMMWLTFYNIIVTNSVTSDTDSYTSSFDEQDVNNAIVWQDHSYTAGKVGTLASAQEYEHEIVSFDKIIVTDPYNHNWGRTWQEQSSVLYIRRQTAPGLFDELILKNMNSMSAIALGGYHKVAVNRIDDPNFTIPVSYFILDELDAIEQMKVYQHILRIDLHALQVVHLDWYETSAFALLFEFAALTITIWSLGTAGGVWAVLQQLVINYMVVELVLFLAEFTGNAEFAAIVGLVALIALGGTNGMPAFDFSTAEGLIKASTDFADNLTMLYNEESKQIQEDLNELNAEASNRLEELNEAAPEDSFITAEFLVALKSVDTQVFPAVQAQYDFDLLYNYDTIIANYHDVNLKTGVI